MSRRMLGLAAFALIAVLFVPSSRGQNKDPGEQTKAKPEVQLIFRAGDLLDRNVLRGPNYAIDEKVPLVGDHYLFTMHTAYGELSILGRRLLDKRVHEMYAVERLRQIGMEPQLLAGALETVKNTQRGLGVLLRDPAGAVLRTPRGLRRMVRGTLEPDERAGSQTRRQLAVQLNCDPETTNPILSSQLDSVAGRRSLGKVLSKVGMSVAVPGLGLVPMTAEIKDVVASSTPAQINAQTQKRLEALGVEEQLARRFVRHPQYTTMRRLQYTYAMEQLRDVENLNALIEAAVAANNETEALGMVETARMLGALHRTEPVAAVGEWGLLHAALRDGRYLALVNDDYVTRRPQLVAAVSAYRSELPEKTTLLVATGALSPEAAELFQTAAMRLLENATAERLAASLEGETPPNSLSEKERAEGWKLLFDGKTTEGWRGYRKKTMPDGWEVREGALVRTGSAGDIVTEKQFDNFELQFEWKVTKGANSGVFYRASEKYPVVYESAPEYQLLDNGGHPDGKKPETSAGSNYALDAPVRDVTKPVGEWNHARIAVDGNHVEHWMNGVKLLEYELNSPKWKEEVAASKFKQWPAYGTFSKGYIAIQDHGAEVALRSIKIREISKQ